MKLGSTRYDAELQMFVEPPAEPDQARLLFLRWLAEHGRLAHDTARETTVDPATERHAEKAAA